MTTENIHKVAQKCVDRLTVTQYYENGGGSLGQPLSFYDDRTHYKGFHIIIALFS